MGGPSHSVCVLLLWLLAVADCRQVLQTFDVGQDSGAGSESEVLLAFLAIGDWGWNSQAQSRTAVQLAKTAAETSAEFVIAVGDNFYERGVQSVSDPLWKQAFEDVYSADSLTSIPWYACMGNHDWGGSRFAQTDMTGQDPHARWNMPSLWYSKSFDICEPGDAVGECASMDVLFIDAIIMGMDYRKIGDVSEQDFRDQMAWLEGALRNSTAGWLLVVGHYFIATVGEHHGSVEGVMSKYLLPLLQAYDVDAYFCGHDHLVEHVVIPNDPARWGEGAAPIHQYLTGHGSKNGRIVVHDPDKATTPYVGLYNDVGGFSLVEVSKTDLRMTMIDGDGNRRYNFTQQVKAHRIRPSSAISDYSDWHSTTSWVPWWIHTPLGQQMLRIAALVTASVGLVTIAVGIYSRRLRCAKGTHHSRQAADIEGRSLILGERGQSINQTSPSPAHNTRSVEAEEKGSKEGFLCEQK